MNLESVQKLQNQKDAGPYLLLCLFLLLLAFFIYLNATAKIQESKAREVLNSLAETFQAGSVQRDINNALLPEFDNHLLPRAFLRKIRSLWASLIGNKKLITSLSSSDIQLIIPANELFLGGEAQLRGDRSDLLKCTARALRVWDAGFESNVQFIITSENMVNGKISQYSDIAIRRAEVLAKKVVEFGAPARTVSVGLRYGMKNLIFVKFGVIKRSNSKTKLQWPVP